MQEDVVWTPHFITCHIHHNTTSMGCLCYGFKVMAQCESPRVAFKIFITWFPCPPQVIVYDKAYQMPTASIRSLGPLKEACLQLTASTVRDMLVVGTTWTSVRRHHSQLLLGGSPVRRLSFQVWVCDGGLSCKELREGLEGMYSNHKWMCLTTFPTC